ncbi:MAG TPA: 2,3-bisphosphoglycerate-independent phosphoglycerate mutase [Oligoflexia bacterium]|nr:2,3-bisphosphoglycerate-independent phosphoglycerate mutase [Oligoflexia bacterium]HMP49222.1 2,3-bisphosphoglycerate-independent phosphoglycerate mutase [Oligoflexia bacterium]
MKKHTPFLLAILDGLALNPNAEFNAVRSANTPVLDSLLETCPWTTLTSFGERVGLPHGQMGNSEVGHLNIGAGRVVEQDLSRINRVCSSNLISTLPEFKELLGSLARNNDAALHLIGLASRGGVHSDLSHLVAIVSAAAASGVKKIRIHCITDGRDRPQKMAVVEINELLNQLSVISSDYPACDIRISTLIGRYFAMDRDNRSERTDKAYQLFVNGIGSFGESGIIDALSQSYKEGITDEFIEAWHFSAKDKSDSDEHLFVRNDDVLMFFNFRADRMRQIVSRFMSDTSLVLSGLYTLTEYDESYSCGVIFPTIEIKNYLGKCLSDNGYSQLRIAETEKYPHVTYFLNGGVEVNLPGEERIMIPSPRDVATYDLKPEMSAVELTEKLISRLEAGGIDCIILNFANCDMVGHTGSFLASVKAVETVDRCLGKILDKIRELGGSALITADHGNADQMIDYETGEPHTYHTLHPVPLILFESVVADASGKKVNSLSPDGSLCDISPTILEYLGLPIPSEMTGRSLLCFD